MIHIDSMVLTKYGFKQAHRVTTDVDIAVVDKDGYVSWMKPKEVKIVRNVPCIISTTIMTGEFCLSTDSEILLNKGSKKLLNLNEYDELLTCNKPITNDYDEYSLLIGLLLSLNKPVVNSVSTFYGKEVDLIKELCTSLGISYDIEFKGSTKGITLYKPIAKEDLYLDKINPTSAVLAFNDRPDIRRGNTDKLLYILALMVLAGKQYRCVTHKDKFRLYKPVYKRVRRKISSQTMDAIYIDTDDKYLMNLCNGSLVYVKG